MGIIERDATRIHAMHETSIHPDPDPERVAELAADMRAHGWQGAPVLTWGDLAISGTHRIVAAREAEVMVPTLDVGAITGDADAKLVQIMECLRLDSLESAAMLFRVVLGDDEAEALGCDLDLHGWTREDALHAIEEMEGGE